MKTDPDLQADVAFAAGPEGDGPSARFTQGASRHTIELECVKCGEELIFTPSTSFGEIQRQSEEHRCAPTALVIPAAFRAVRSNASH